MEGNQENLTNHPAYDGRSGLVSRRNEDCIRFQRRDGGPFQIHVMDADGKNVIRLTDGPGDEAASGLVSRRG